MRLSRRSAFVVTYPKKREVFAAMFRDRIVHHLYFRYTHQLFERTFIAETYSCIQGRGTHYGVNRLRQHIRQASLNWSEKCYAMNLDIRGYFMHIDRERLLKISTESLNNMRHHRVWLTDDVPIPSGVLLTPQTTWNDIRDFEFILWLTEKIVMLDPMENCIIVGDESDWDDIDHAKCMRFAKDGMALPIGNLTSQLFSNVYLNPFDQYVKRDLLCRHYGRYVDDSTMVDPDRYWLLAQVPKIREFMADELGLQLHMGKLHVRDVNQGVEFLGAFVKPYRDYISRHTLERIEHNIKTIDLRNAKNVCSTVNSYFGVLSHSSSYRIRQRLFNTDDFASVIEIDADMLKSKPKAE